MPRPASVWLLLFLLAVIATGADARRHPAKRTVRPTSATHKERLSKEAQLAKLKKEIAETERQLNEHTRREKLTKKQLAERDARTKKLKAKLVALKAEAAELQSEEKELDTSIKTTASTIDTLKRNYADDASRRYVSGLYRASVTTGSGFDDPGEEATRRRNTYYSSIAATALHRNKQTLDSTKTSLTENREEVASMLDEQLGAISQTTEEQHSVEAERATKAKELQSIQQKKTALQKELERRKQSAKRLEAIIVNLAAKEEAEIKRKKEALRKRELARKSKVKAGKKLTVQEKHQEAVDTEEKKSLAGPHSLGWPCGSHRIVQGYGEQRNKELGTVTMNLGIDIGTAEGSAVHAAEKGTVALVSSLPSYGSLVIIRHSGGVLTVYAGLESISVSSGSAVSKGSTIGKSGTSSELGAILHFEVWRGRSKQNPMGWLNK
jgi:septal ring factor EnvC (AmiA/AmiB activator)